MKPELLDCHWCGSARSIEFGLCQVCLIEYPPGVTIVTLPETRGSDGASFNVSAHGMDTPDVLGEPRVGLAAGE